LTAIRAVIVFNVISDTQTGSSASGENESIRIDLNDGKRIPVIDGMLTTRLQFRHGGMYRLRKRAALAGEMRHIAKHSMAATSRHAATLRSHCGLGNC